MEIDSEFICVLNTLEDTRLQRWSDYLWKQGKNINSHFYWLSAEWLSAIGYQQDKEISFFLLPTADG
jgi:hypothetical protein